MKYSAQNYLKNFFWYSALAAIIITAVCILLSLNCNDETILNSNQTYMLQLVSIITLILIPIGIFNFNRILEKVNKNNKEAFDKKYKTKGAMRNGITAACVIINSAVYFLANYESAIYCVAIGIAAHIYCYPSRKEYNNLLEGNTTK